jgi:hypothetical protein
MADLSKLKRRSWLGAPPAPDEASANLTAPEVAPAAPSEQASPPEAPPLPKVPRRAESERKSERRRIDGRSLRKTGRTLQFATRVTEEFDELLHKIAERDGLKLVEVLENSVAAYEAARRKQDRS